MVILSWNLSTAKIKSLCNWQWWYSGDTLTKSDKFKLKTFHQYLFVNHLNQTVSQGQKCLPDPFPKKENKDVKISKLHPQIFAIFNDYVLSISPKMAKACNAAQPHPPNQLTINTNHIIILST